MTNQNSNNTKGSKMLEIIWRMRTKVLDDEGDLGALISAAVQLPGMEAAHYDLNRKGQWRGFDMQHIVVDAMTQRTQLVAIRGEDAESGAQAMIALGKHGEQPTAIIRVPEERGVSRDIIATWPELYDTLELASTHLISDARRDVLERAGLDTPAIGGALAIAWHASRVPAGLRGLEPARIAGTPVCLEQRPSHWCIDFGQAPIAVETLAQESGYRAALGYINTCLIES